ncbi:SOS response associated peptidase (SRAP) [Sphingobium sp. AP50]|uniref:SOS response-associated peptidase family protein n=1 Tax=Sphingobium sp. AP50 TaxID=1884369 RepID=UPI0008BBB47E|nr:SOS response-associated peptidase family protein [Sphingobium sp. AP50]SEJ80911.1 SOS response associated peptidase (SRAP) [Sphingobium sp. AP50]
MSRLHIFAASLVDIATHFDVADVPEIDLPSETIEGARGLAVFEHQGQRRLKGMDWGFPRVTREMRERGEMPGRVGLVADLTNPLWDKLVADPRYRCIIPITHFANPDGAQGSKTRTWFSMKGQRMMAWAGFCRNVPDYGPVYAGMTMPANAAVEPTNDRMPVLLEPRHYERWLKGSIREVIDFQFSAPAAAARMEVEKTEDLWRSGALPGSGRPQLALL